MATYQSALNGFQWRLSSQHHHQQQQQHILTEPRTTASFDRSMTAVTADPSTLVSSSMNIANGLDATRPGDFSAWTNTSLAHSGFIEQPPIPSSVALQTHAILSSTPPPDLASYAREQTMYGSQTQVFSSLPHQPIAQPPEFYLRGTSLEETPLSSPSSNDSLNMQDTEDVYRHASIATTQCNLPISRSRSPLVDYQITATNAAGTAPSYEYSSSAYGMVAAEPQEIVEREHSIQKTVKMPQRKGGIQLWQFLYALLTDPDKKYKDIMEWTSKAQEREFRMLEPEAIAIWWGHHKNKPNMSYDKFSRSLRYYYDKGILRKIPGERYVYRFLIDPETMYQHIGISDCRPKLKAMPQAAKVALNKFNKDQSLDFTTDNSPIITQAPEQLTDSCETKTESINLHPSCSVASPPTDAASTLEMAPPPYPFEPKYTTTAMTSTHSSTMSIASLATRRTRSLDYPSSSSNSNLTSPQAVPPYSPSSASLPAGIDFRGPYDIFPSTQSPLTSPNHSNVESFCESPVITTTDMELNYSDMIPFTTSEADMYFQSQLSGSYTGPQLSTSEYQLNQFNPELCYVSAQLWPHMN